MIYKLCIPKFDDEGPHKLALRRHGGQAGEMPFHMRIGYYNLSKACRSIRAEFRPLILSKTPKWVPIGSFASYIATFHPNTRHIVDDVWVDILELCLKGSRIDILPILHCMFKHRHLFFCAFNHEVRLSMGAGLVGLKELLNECVWQMASSEWRVAARKLASIVPNNSTKRVVVSVEAKFKEKKAGVRKDFEAALLRDLGLDGGERWKSIIKYV